MMNEETLRRNPEPASAAQRMKRHFKSEQLRTFLVVAQLRSFTKAAKVLHLTQAAVSTQLRQLEAEASVKLLARTPGSLTLTPAGETLRTYAERILDLHEQAREELACESSENILRVGTPDAYARLIFPAALRALTDQFPKIRVDVVCVPTLELGRRLESGALDLAVGTCCSQFPGPPIFFEELVWVALESATGLAALRPIPLALFEIGSVPRSLVAEALGTAGIPYRCVYASPDTAGILAAVQTGKAVAALPIHSISGDLKILGRHENLPDLPSLALTVATGRTPNRPEKDALMALLTQRASSKLRTTRD
ncbi:LysR family transcriptional regulator [Cupriavidus sp. 2KB_3]|uniref:LysR family transcriptional regulator n=1 Tax=Cupriavidus TaxID=106589 RepID=UPI0011EDAAE8|nr:LysR family transcriptional regulator [Cupriavidus campinensis]